MDVERIEARKGRRAPGSKPCATGSWRRSRRSRTRCPPDAPLADQPAGRFVRTPWNRTDHSGEPGGGGVMAMMKGRVFEKVGVHVSAVFGEFAPEFRKEIPGAADDPRFFATGISLIAHLQNPHVPAVHMNTRFVVTTKSWFGGGADLTPVLLARRYAGRPGHDRIPRRLKAACDKHAAVAPYEKFKTWCDEYFFLKHRGETRGIGGIFYDWLDCGDFVADFAFTQDVGRAFLGIYPELVRAKFCQAVDRGRARGTARAPRTLRRVQSALRPRDGFRLAHRRQRGVRSLSSMPPVVKWP